MLGLFELLHLSRRPQKNEEDHDVDHHCGQKPPEVHRPVEPLLAPTHGHPSVGECTVEPVGMAHVLGISGERCAAIARQPCKGLVSPPQDGGAGS
eukprot:7338324-Prymnesium_polylepis.2